MDINTKKNSTVEELKSIIFVVALALFIRIFLIEPFFVPTGSMKVTVLEGDYIFSTKYSYGYSKHSIPFSPDFFSGRILSSKPERGDIIIFRPPMNMDIRYIKRLIGLPGDKIQLINNVVYINDKPIEREEVGEIIGEDGTKYRKYKETLPNGVSYLAYKTDPEQSSSVNNSYHSNTAVFYVPNDKYFFLGDNRDNSRDSRVDLGFVPFENFIAKGQFILFSTKEMLWPQNVGFLEGFTRIWTWLSSIRTERLFRNIYSID
jgi:signal peptidase I